MHQVYSQEILCTRFPCEITCPDNTLKMERIQALNDVIESHGEVRLESFNQFVTIQCMISSISPEAIQRFKEIYEEHYGAITLDEAGEKAERFFEFIRLMVD